MIWPFFGALALGVGTLAERIVLRKDSVSVRFYQVAQFFAMVLLMLPFIYFFWNVSSNFYSVKNVGIFVVIIVFSLIANFFTFYSMKWERLGKLESAKITEPLFVILLAFIFSFIFGQELFSRNPKILVPAFISAGALIFSHVQKHHLKFSKYYLAALVGSFFFAAELIMSRLILDYFNPITFYFLRSIFILFVSVILFRPKFKGGIEKKTMLQILFAGGVWLIYRLIVYFGYTSLGVVETTLTIMLGPVLVYFFTWKFLKEKLTWRNLVAAGVILVSVLYVVLT